MKKIVGMLLVMGYGWGAVSAQQAQPKVVIGIVVDQMRADYLSTFSENYSNGGFQKLKSEGTWFKNCYINYLPSYTGPGHASIYTGSVPAIHGIVGNDWYDRKGGTSVYCANDGSCVAVGGSPVAGFVSPRRMNVTTITDELRLATNNRSRTFAMSLKDRGAALPGGHTATAAYWMDDSLGHFMSSSFYMKNLPSWVNDFNIAEKVRDYLDKGWQPINNIQDYLYNENTPSIYEGRLGDDKANTFPYVFKNQSNAIIKRTPHGNSILFDFAKATIENEEIGKGDYPDFLAISFSATDYIGHNFGPNSMEVEDTYLRFDIELANFLHYLDKKFGKNNYLLFLTADHGAAHNPSYLVDKKIPAGYFFGSKEKEKLNNDLLKKFGQENLCDFIDNGQVYLNKEKVQTDTLRKKLIEEVVTYFERNDAVQFVVDIKKISQASMPNMLKELVLNSYNPERSGDVAFILKPAYLDAYATTGTSHGVWNAYDTKIPLLFYGKNISAQHINETVYMTDIAPTIANLLGISPPNGCVGKPILPRD